jgi:bifunctional enzyme Fae/Hps
LTLGNLILKLKSRAARDIIQIRMLNRKLRYLQIALNSTLSEAKEIINQLPVHERIILEAGTPLIKEFGADAIRKIRVWWENRTFIPARKQPYPKSGIDLGRILIDAFVSGRKEGFNQRPKITKKFEPYIVADLKCMDRGEREVKIATQAGASAVVVLGEAPIETLDAFIENCHRFGAEPIIDMMNVDQPFKVLRKLKKLPKVVMLHRGVDETEMSEKPLPIHQINKIKGSYNVMISIGGGDTIREVQRAIFNGADIVMVWKAFYESSAEIKKLANEFLKEIK